MSASPPPTSRVSVQSSYFERRSGEFKREARPFRHLSLPLYFASVGCVLIHLAADALARRSLLPAESRWHHVANTEHFMEGEHREWLHLLYEAEWFV